MTIMHYAVTLLALPYAERKTIHHDTLMVDEGMVELEERSLWHSLSYRCKAGQSGTFDQPSPLFGFEKDTLMEILWI